MMRTIIAVALLAGSLAVLPGCETTGGGVRVENQSPFPYNSRW